MGQLKRCAGFGVAPTLLLLALALASRPAAACTSYMVAPGASPDGSIIIAVRLAWQ